MEDLTAAIVYRREALTVGHPGPFDLSNLANALLVLYQKLGEIKDLDEAIASYNKACSLHSSNYSKCIDSLANATSLLYKPFGRLANLDDAIEDHYKSLSPDHSGQLGCRFYDLATDLIHHKQIRYKEEVNKEIEVHQAALSNTDDFDRSISLQNLAIAHLDRFDLLSHMRDLEEAIIFLHQAVYLCQPQQCAKDLTWAGGAPSEEAVAPDINDEVVCPSGTATHL